MTAPAVLDAPIRAGLNKVDKLLPGQGYAELLGGARSGMTGIEAFAHSELGVKFMPGGSAFAFADAVAVPNFGVNWQAGIGARMTW